MNKNIGVMLDAHLKEITEKSKKAAIEAYVEVIDKEAEQCFQNIKEDTPESDSLETTKDVGNLKSSILKEKINDPNKYGYKIYFDGYNSKGVAYQKIANALNSGATLKSGGIIEPRWFISKAVHKLKNMDLRINKKFLQKINKK